MRVERKSMNSKEKYIASLLDSGPKNAVAIPPSTAKLMK
jgi:hypothetical protein